MKKTRIIIALTLGAALVSSINAQQYTQTNAQYGDLFLAFETTGGAGSKDLLIDLGSATNSTALASLNVNLNADLTSVFGANYSTNVSYGL